MILGHLNDTERYEALHPRLREVFAYLREHNLANELAGRIELDGDRLFINRDDVVTASAEERLLECHRRYLDVQILLEGRERIGWSPLCSCHEVAQPYDEVRDIAFYSDRPQTYIEMAVGGFVLFYPEDAHAPLVGDGSAVRKAVVKLQL